MSKKFVVEVRFTGITVETALRVLEDMVLNTRITARGFWHVMQDEYADRAIINGELVWRDSPVSSVSNLAVQEYSCKLVTPLMSSWDFSTMRLAVGVMNRLFDYGAVVLSPQCIKVHFVDGFSAMKCEAISRRIADGNKLLYTMLFFPTFLAPFWVPDREVSNNSELDLAIYHSYKEIVNGLAYHNSDMSVVINRIVADLIYSGDNMTPEEELGKYKVRFDRDSSPDSVDSE